MRGHLGGIAGLLIALLAFTACGGGGNGGDDDADGLQVIPTGITVRDAWIRPAVLPVGAPTPDPDQTEAPNSVISAMYLVIESSRGQSIDLVEIQTDIAWAVEIHESHTHNGLTRMHPVDAVTVPANGRVAFEPGGLHIMLIGISQELEPGDEWPVTLIFHTGERYELPAVPVLDQ